MLTSVIRSLFKDFIIRDFISQTHVKVVITQLSIKKTTTFSCLNNVSRLLVNISLILIQICLKKKIQIF